MKRIFTALFFVICCASPLSAQSPYENLLQGKNIEGVDFNSGVEAIVDGTFAQDGVAWNAPQAATSRASTARITIDLASETSMSALVLQADWNDVYVVEGSHDRDSWEQIWYAPQKGYAAGLVTRTIRFDAPKTFRYLRVRGARGDGVLSISEFQAYSTIPPFWDLLENRASTANPYSWIPVLTPDRVDSLRTVVIGLALLVLVWGGALRSVGREEHLRKFRRILLGLLTFIGYCSWSNFFQFHYGSVVHRHEFFHYYLGSKYLPELSYTRLYQCAAIADDEDGFFRAKLERKIRDLHSNNLVSALTTLEHPEVCRSHFTDERWRAFKRDLSWFRQSMPEDDYLKAQGDHGFNGTPVWAFFGRVLSSLAPASTSQIFGLGLLDLILLSGAFLFLFRTFGFETGCVAVLFWSTNGIARFAWTGNGFLRADWIAYGILGICFLKRRQLFSGGFFLALSGMARIFPFALLGGLFLKLFVDCVSRRSLLPLQEYRRSIVGAFVSLALFCTLATISAGSTDIWRDFSANTEKHYRTISTNIVGLRVVMMGSADSWAVQYEDNALSEPFSVWWKVKQDLFSHRAPIFWVLAALYLALLVKGAARLEAWGAACLGMGIIVFINLANYDYYALLFPGLLTAVQPLIGISIAALAWLSWSAFSLVRDMDKSFFLCSLLSAVWVFALTAFFALKKNSRE